MGGSVNLWALRSVRIYLTHSHDARVRVYEYLCVAIPLNVGGETTRSVVPLRCSACYMFNLLFDRDVDG